MKRFVALCLMAVAFATAPAFSDGLDRGAVAYLKGDYKTALREFQPLAEQGGVGAQFFLGVMYENGQGVPQDYVRAHMWINLAVSKGGGLATENRDSVAKKMTPSQIEKAQDLARECLAKDYKGC